MIVINVKNNSQKKLKKNLNMMIANHIKKLTQREINYKSSIII